MKCVEIPIMIVFEHQRSRPIRVSFTVGIENKVSGVLFVCKSVLLVAYWVALGNFTGSEKLLPDLS